MAKQITRDEVAALARLAQLNLSNEQLDHYKKDLNSILGYIDILNTVDTTGKKPTSQVTGLENVMRDDVVEKQLASPEELLACAPKRKDNYIQVERML